MVKRKSPEISINSGEIIEHARTAVAARAIIAEKTTVEDQGKKRIRELSDGIRIEKLGNKEYIGIIRITGNDLPPVRVEFRMDGALDMIESDKLDRIFGTLRPQLFQPKEIVTSITDPAGLIQEMIDQGKNPWDYLKIEVKDGMDSIVARYLYVISQSALVPTEEFLNTLNDVRDTLSDEAVMYLEDFLTTAQKPRVVLGTK